MLLHTIEDTQTFHLDVTTDELLQANGFAQNTAMQPTSTNATYNKTFQRAVQA
jgi:hypothetical protein